MDLNKILKDYSQLNLAEKKSTQEEIIADRTLLNELVEYVTGQYARPATRILADISKRIKSAALLNLDKIKALLCCDDPKVRMHAAEILGNTSADVCLPYLIDAINREQVCFVLPSLLLAIGKAKSETAESFLNSYNIKSNLLKHINTEKIALQKALSNFSVRMPTQVCLLPGDILYLNSSNLTVTARTFQGSGFSIGFAREFITIKNIKDYQDIFNTRSFRDAFIYLGATKTHQLPEYLNKIEDTISQRLSAKNYRFEVKNVAHNIRKQIIAQCTKSFNYLVNSPSSYSFEILLYIYDDIATVLLNPLTDNRFCYRKKSVAASIAPSTGACVLEFASKYLNPNANVLDNFCGSGTLLFERSFYPYKSLTGIDIDKKAISAANTNAANFINKPKFINTDALNYRHKKYDEIIANMPFGNRVGNHKRNVCLYKRYFEMLPGLLAPNGTAILYTNEKKLTQELISQNDSIELIDKESFNSGGLTPSAYILKYTI